MLFEENNFQSKYHKTDSLPGSRGKNFYNRDSLFSGLSRLRGTTLYELFHTYQQRGLNWYESKQRSIKDIVSAFKVKTHLLILANDSKGATARYTSLVQRHL